MGRQERIVVIGAGIIGCAVAFELSRRGARVTVYDSRDVGGGATHASAGILAPYTEAHEGGRLFELTVRGLDAYDEFVVRVRSASPAPFEYRRSGTIEVACDAGRASELQARLDEPWARQAGLEWLDADALRVRVPLVNEQAIGGLLCVAHGHVAVQAFTQAMASAARAHGCRFVCRVGVETVEVASSEIVIHASVGIESFDRVVLCAGAWTPAVDPTGVASGRISPVRGQLVRLATTPGALEQVLWSPACYLVPWDDGTVLVGATSEDVGFDERATASGVHELLSAGVELMPSLASATFGDVLVGLRPAGVGGVPILGPVGDPRILFAAGHYRNGVLLAPLTAQLLANYVFTNATDPAFSAA